jgi:hypothetical protein
VITGVGVGCMGIMGVAVVDARGDGGGGMMIS